MPARLTPDDAALAAALAGGPTVRLDSADSLPTPPGAAICVATSGSTSGTPSVVALSADNLRASATATHRALGGPGAWLLTVPPDHVAGLMVRARALLTAQPVLTSPGPFRADTFARAVARLEQVAGPGRTYCSLVPTQLRRVLDDPAAREAAARLTTILVGGAATPSATLAAAREAGIAVVTTYGMTETCGGCVYDGEPLDGVQVSIGEAGVISLTGPQVALGYLTPHGLAAFAGSFTTSDRGYLEGGRLRVLGRVDDVILTGGVNVDPHQIEQVLLAHDGVAEVCVVGLPHREWGQEVVAAVVPAAVVGIDEVIDRMRAMVRERLGAAWVPRVVVRDRLPLRGPGKVDRRALAEQLSGESASGPAETLSGHDS